MFGGLTIEKQLCKQYFYMPFFILGKDSVCMKLGRVLEKLRLVLFGFDIELLLTTLHFYFY